METQKHTGSGLSPGPHVTAPASSLTVPTETMRELIARQQILMLATQHSDGSAHVVPVVYLFEDGRFLIATSSRSRKLRNVAARPQVTVTIEDREKTAWVSATGHAQVLRGQKSREINHRLDALWMTEEGFGAIGTLVAQHEDVTVVIVPKLWRSWDFQSDFLAELEAGGAPLHEAHGWFH